VSDLMSTIQDPKIDFEDCTDCYARPRNLLRELSANFYGKAALREAVTAKSVSHTC